MVFAPHEIDHVIAFKHGGPTELDNLALSCALCNQHKGSDLTSIDPDTGQIVALFHPRQMEWTDHFQWEDAVLVPLSPTGRVTVQLLQLNWADRIEERLLLMKAGLHPPEDR
jgi:hypothetical protein